MAPSEGFEPPTPSLGRIYSSLPVTHDRLGKLATRLTTGCTLAVGVDSVLGIPQQGALDSGC
jgi:hypothetical protein